MNPEAILKQLETTKEYVSPAELAVPYIGLGDKEQSLSALERAYTAHDLQMAFLGIDLHVDPLRSEPLPGNAAQLIATDGFWARLE